MTHPSDLDLIWVRILDPIKLRLGHRGFIERNFIQGEDSGFVGSQPQLPLQKGPSPLLRIVVEVLESFRCMMGWRTGIGSGRLKRPTTPDDKKDPQIYNHHQKDMR